MPTGYTQPVRDGKVSFNQFVWLCARAMGALAAVRDDNLGARIELSAVEEATDFYEQELKRARGELLELEQMSAEQVDVLRLQDYENAKRRVEESRAENRRVRERYGDMISLVTRWEPPTADHIEFQQFMLRQLRDSIDFDCYEVADPPELDAQEWYAAERDRAARNILYFTQALGKVRERNAKRRAWVDALLECVPYESPPK